MKTANDAASLEIEERKKRDVAIDVPDRRREVIIHGRTKPGGIQQRKNSCSGALSEPRLWKDTFQRRQFADRRSEFTVGMSQLWPK